MHIHYSLYSASEGRCCGSTRSFLVSLTESFGLLSFPHVFFSNDELISLLHACIHTHTHTHTYIHTHTRIHKHTHKHKQNASYLTIFQSQRRTRHRAAEACAPLRCCSLQRTPRASASPSAVRRLNSRAAAQRRHTGRREEARSKEPTTVLLFRENKASARHSSGERRRSYHPWLDRTQAAARSSFDFAKREKQKQRQRRDRHCFPTLPADCFPYSVALSTYRSAATFPTCNAGTTETHLRD